MTTNTKLRLTITALAMAGTATHALADEVVTEKESTVIIKEIPEPAPAKPAAAKPAPAKPAAAPAVGNWYAGAAGGYSHTNANAEDMHPNLAADHGGINSILSIDRSSFGWKAFVGYQYNANFAVEASYTDLGTFTNDADTAGDGLVSTKLDPWALCLSGVGTWPIQKQIGLTGRLGICRWDDGFSSSVAEPMEYSDGVDPVLGIGASYEINSRMSVRAEYERYLNVIHDDKDADLLSIGLLYKF